MDNVRRRSVAHGSGSVLMEEMSDLKWRWRAFGAGADPEIAVSIRRDFPDLRSCAESVAAVRDLAHLSRLVARREPGFGVMISNS